MERQWLLRRINGLIDTLLGFGLITATVLIPTSALVKAAVLLVVLFGLCALARVGRLPVGKRITVGTIDDSPQTTTAPLGNKPSFWEKFWRKTNGYSPIWQELALGIGGLLLILVALGVIRF